jgi:spore germination cell wall hydrolase CwlJ-like protein
MGVRSPRRMWHLAAALAPLPLIVLGYVSKPGNQISFRLELLLSGNGSAHALKETQSAEHQALPRAAAPLFAQAGKGPRADQYLALKKTTFAGKHFVAASVGGAGGDTGEKLHANKSDSLNRPAAAPVNTGVSSFIDAPAAAMFLQPALNTEPGLPAPEAIAYRPTQGALNFKSKGESQAEFEERERRCLATAIYFEARGESVEGQVAVGQVILNRVRSPQFPETICGVVYQGQMAPGCQFSFACDGKTDNPRKDAQWAQAQDLARKISSGQVWLPEVGYSTYYHANYVSPRWIGDMSKIDRIGRHIFYKKRNEQPYVVEASSSGTTPVSVAAVAGSDSTVSANPNLSLGMAPSE